LKGKVRYEATVMMYSQQLKWEGLEEVCKTLGNDEKMLQDL
jgi:hypothetical protein